MGAGGRGISPATVTRSSRGEDKAVPVGTVCRGGARAETAHAASQKRRTKSDTVPGQTLLRHARATTHPGPFPRLSSPTQQRSSAFAMSAPPPPLPRSPPPSNLRVLRHQPANAASVERIQVLHDHPPHLPLPVHAVRVRGSRSCHRQEQPQQQDQEHPAGSMASHDTAATAQRNGTKKGGGAKMEGVRERGGSTAREGGERHRSRAHGENRPGVVVLGMGGARPGARQASGGTQGRSCTDQGWQAALCGRGRTRLLAAGTGRGSLRQLRACSEPPRAGHPPPFEPLPHSPPETGERVAAATAHKHQAGRV